MAVLEAPLTPAHPHGQFRARPAHGSLSLEPGPGLVLRPEAATSFAVGLHVASGFRDSPEMGSATVWRKNLYEMRLFLRRDWARGGDSPGPDVPVGPQVVSDLSAESVLLSFPACPQLCLEKPVAAETLSSEPSTPASSQGGSPEPQRLCQLQHPHIQQGSWQKART